MPNFFWESEPTLHPLYAAIREYLEIDPRIKVLNERCRVFLDLAEILSDSVASSKMSVITWIIIVLIVVSIMVTITEVLIRFGMMTKAKTPSVIVPDIHISNPNDATPPPPLPLLVAGGVPPVALPPSDLELLARTLGLEANATLEDVRDGIEALRKEAAAGDSQLVQGSS